MRRPCDGTTLLPGRCTTDLLAQSCVRRATRGFSSPSHALAMQDSHQYREHEDEREHGDSH
eukprot:3332770-Pyramimonas_sp.AAC.1